MGQYFKAFVQEERKGAKGHIYGSLGKLTEFCYFDVKAATTISAKLYKHKMKLCVMGDYADYVLSEGKKYPKELSERYKEIWEKCWGNGYEEREEALGEIVEFDFKGKVLCNHARHTFMSFDEYSDRVMYLTPGGPFDAQINPIFLLTAIGNKSGGNNGGDYYGCFEEDLGTWAMDTISIEDKAPKGYKQSYYCFVEPQEEP